MRRRTIVKLTFMSCCLLLFLYKTYEVFYSWREDEIVTKIYHEKQENLPMPLICLSTRNRRFYIRNRNDVDGVGSTENRVNLFGETLSYQDYKNGTWKLRNRVEHSWYEIMMLLLALLCHKEPARRIQSPILPPILSLLS